MQAKDLGLTANACLNTIWSMGKLRSIVVATKAIPTGSVLF